MSSIGRRFKLQTLRAMGMIDHDPTSLTYGCADRNYWHYQDGKSFAVGSFQVAMLGLRVAGHIFPEQSKLFHSASDAARTWWEQRILSSGMLDEYFVAQRSFCATAYTALAAAVCDLDRKRHQVNSVVSQNGLKFALNELASAKHRPESANQSLAARIAWDIGAQLSLTEGPNPFEVKQDQEGWLNEYGGFDLGYSLKCVDLCTLALLILENQKSRKYYEGLLLRLLEFLDDVVHNYTFAPALGSRGNPHGLFGGLSVLASEGHAVAKGLLATLSDNRNYPLVSAESSDDKYFAFFHFTSLCLSVHSEDPVRGIFRDQVRLKECAPRPLGQAQKFFAGAGLAFFRTTGGRVAISLSAGGATHLQTAGTIETHGGYVFRDGRTLWSTAGTKSFYDIHENGDLRRIDMPLFASRKKSRTALVQNPVTSFLLKTALLTPAIGRLIRKMIYEKTARNGAARKIGIRRIHLSDGQVSIEDSFETPIQNLFQYSCWTTQDGHATRLFGDSELEIFTEARD